MNRGHERNFRLHTRPYKDEPVSRWLVADINPKMITLRDLETARKVALIEANAHKALLEYRQVNVPTEDVAIRVVSVTTQDLGDEGFRLLCTARVGQDTKVRDVPLIDFYIQRIAVITSPLF